MTKTNRSSVIIYSTPTCAFCKTEKQYLEHLGVDFVVKDIELDPKNREELIEKLGDTFTGVPVTDIDGELVRGFDRARIDQLLRAKKLLPS